MSDERRVAQDLAIILRGLRDFQWSTVTDPSVWDVAKWEIQEELVEMGSFTVRVAGDNYRITVTAES